MTWKFMPAKVTYPNDDPDLVEDSWSIREVYFDKTGAMNGHTGPIDPHGSDLEELKATLKLMLSEVEKGEYLDLTGDEPTLRKV